MNEANSDNISRNHSHHPMLRFNTPLYQIESRIPTRINSTSSSTLDYCFEARIWSISSIVTAIGVANSGFTLTTEKPNDASKAHSIYHSSNTHDWDLTVYYFSYNETAISSSIGMMFLSLHLSEDADLIFLY